MPGILLIAVPVLILVGAYLIGTTTELDQRRWILGPLAWAIAFVIAFLQAGGGIR